MSLFETATPLVTQQRLRPAWRWAMLIHPAAVAVALAAVLAGHAAVAAGAAMAGGLPWALAAAAALGAMGGVLQAGMVQPAVPRRGVAALAGLLLLLGVFAAHRVSAAAAALALVVGAALVALHLGGCRRPWFGPLLTGAAFAGLFLLGAAVEPEALAPAAPAAAAPFCYGAAFGIVGRGPEWRGDQRPALLAIALLLAAILLPLGLGWVGDYAGLSAAPFALVLAWWVLPDFLWGASDPRPLPVQTALTAGRLSAPALAAALAAGFGGMLVGATLLLLVPLAGLLERVLGGR